MSRLLAVISAAGLLGGVGVATAQPMARSEGPPPADIQAMHQAHERQMAQDLRTVLRLRPDQEPALAAFMAAMAPPGMPMHAEEPKPGAMNLTTPQRLDMMARHEAEMAAMAERHRRAISAFYAALTPEQQQVFDALQRMHGGLGHRGHGGMMMHHGGMGPRPMGHGIAPMDGPDVPPPPR